MAGELHYISQDAVIRVIRHCRRLEDRLALAMSYLHALRVSELCAIRVRHIQGDYLDIQALKGGIHAHQRLIDHEVPELNEVHMLRHLMARGYYEIHSKIGLGPEDYLFVNRRPRNKNKTRDNANGAYFWRLLRKIQAPAGIPEHTAHPHMLRHSAAMQMLESGAKLNDIQRWLRHRSLSSTGVYLQSTDEKASAAALAAFTGRPAVNVQESESKLRGIK